MDSSRSRPSRPPWPLGRTPPAFDGAKLLMSVRRTLASCLDRSRARADPPRDGSAFWPVSVPRRRHLSAHLAAAARRRTSPRSRLPSVAWWIVGWSRSARESAGHAPSSPKPGFRSFAGWCWTGATGPGALRASAAGTRSRVERLSRFPRWHPSCAARRGRGEETAVNEFTVEWQRNPAVQWIRPIGRAAATRDRDRVLDRARVCPDEGGCPGRPRTLNARILATSGATTKAEPGRLGGPP